MKETSICFKKEKVYIISPLSWVTSGHRTKQFCLGIYCLLDLLGRCSHFRQYTQREYLIQTACILIPAIGMHVVLGTVSSMSNVWRIAKLESLSSVPSKFAFSVASTAWGLLSCCVPSNIAKFWQFRLKKLLQWWTCAPSGNTEPAVITYLLGTGSIIRVLGSLVENRSRLGQDLEMASDGTSAAHIVWTDLCVHISASRGNPPRPILVSATGMYGHHRAPPEIETFLDLGILATWCATSAPTPSVCIQRMWPETRTHELSPVNYSEIS